jgi:hypothetical protein
VNQNAPTGICCIKKISGVIPPDPHIKGIRVGKGFKRNNKGDKKEVKGKSREGCNRKGVKGMRGASKEEGKGQGEAQCSRITF